QKTFRNMIKSLDISSVNSARLSLRRVFEEVFSDRNCNWGRIVTIVAFSVEVSRFGQKLNNEDSKHFPEKISEFVSEYINEYLSTWIVSQGGW
ncbi:hypothetical protein HELRODRAFT_152831, partial [Helobdella robusta]|uniref:Bcl-2 Bcl-2 homology region 1-3 domain-containing protein n=1 Tax=Helobdella robusta TaxID=6412 RepID=T1EKX5_HELRO